MSVIYNKSFSVSDLRNPSFSLFLRWELPDDVLSHVFQDFYWKDDFSEDDKNPSCFFMRDIEPEDFLGEESLQPFVQQVFSFLENHSVCGLVYHPEHDWTEVSLRTWNRTDRRSVHVINEYRYVGEHDVRFPNPVDDDVNFCRRVSAPENNLGIRSIYSEILTDEQFDIWKSDFEFAERRGEY